MHKRGTFESKTWAFVRTTYRLLAVIAIVGAVIGQFIYSSYTSPTFSGWNFFSFFTIESNIIGAIALLWAVLARKKTAVIDSFRGAATLYLTITGIVVIVLLGNVAGDLTLPIVDLILHKIMPVVMILDWLLDPPQARLQIKLILVWFIYPLVWLAYTLLRGPLVHWYPYPFLDPAKNGGYTTVGLYVVGIMIFAIIIAAILVIVANAITTFKKKT